MYFPNEIKQIVDGPTTRFIFIFILLIQKQCSSFINSTTCINHRPQIQQMSKKK